MKASFILDNSISARLKPLFGNAIVRTITECGLAPNADDGEVIALAFNKSAIIVTTDAKFVQKCKAFQGRHRCMSGLVLLPDGEETQVRILRDLKNGRKKLSHPKLDPVTWALIRSENMLVRTQASGHPTVSELCACPWS
jgi:predicted nuclease of predicted toxin-antitoxin system